MSPTYYNLEALLTSTAAEDEERASLIEQCVSDPAFDGRLEPMTIVVHCYYGFGDIRYNFPNSDNTYDYTRYDRAHQMSSLHKANTWRFMHNDVLRALGDLANGEQHRRCWHFLCARFKPEDARKKNLYPLLLVGEPAGGQDYRRFSVRNCQPSTSVDYLQYCYEQNKRWLATIK